MPRTRQAPALEPSTDLVAPGNTTVLSVPHRLPPKRALTAAGANMAEQPDTTASKLASGAAWQEKSWAFYDSVGELRAGANWLGNALSRVRLYIADGDGEELETGPAVDFLSKLFGGEEGMSQALRTIAIQLTVPGETWVIGRGADAKTGDADEWLVASQSEVKVQGKRWQLDRGDGQVIVVDPAEGDVIVRIWRPHPRQWAQADSPVRALIGVLAELLQLTKKVAAGIDSRLAGAGVLFLPNEMTFTSPKDDDGNDLYPDFFSWFTDAIMTAIDDQADASALVPVVVQAPGATLAAVQHLRFDTALSAEDRELRIEAIRRLGLGMDIPVEIMTGTGEANHWGAWQIDEAAIKIHIEPMLELVCQGFTQFLLHPFLKGGSESISDADRALRIRSDTSDLRLRPNRPAEAQALYDDGELKGDTLRRENGFDDGDKPDQGELEQILLRKVAIAGVTPEMSAAALEQLGVHLDLPEPVQDAPAPRGVAAVPPLEPEVADPNRPPEQLAASGARSIGQEIVALNCAAQLVCTRSLERARNKLGRRGAGALRPVEAHRAEEALSGEFAQVAEVAAALGYHPDRLGPVLRAYCLEALTKGEDHDARILASLMENFVRREAVDG